MSYDNYVDALQKGHSYVTDGASHILDFSVNGLEAGTRNSELSIKGNQSINIRARVIANLPERQDDADAAIAERPLDEQPYWHIERARVDKTRKVRVELIVNGEAVDSEEIVADGQGKDIAFAYAMRESAWVALRIYPSSHTNPVFVKVNGNPIRVLKSAQWCRAVVDQCWKMKEPKIRQEEKEAAKHAYDDARKVYDNIIEEASR
jgi:hypothetical protein